MSTARKKQEMERNSLRRGFLGAHDPNQLNSPDEFRAINTQRMEKMKEHRRFFYEKLGRPNKKNLTLKFKGREHLLGKDQYDARAYFELGEEIKRLADQNLAVKQWADANCAPIGELELLHRAIFEVVGRDLAKQVIAHFGKLREGTFNRAEWDKFLTNLLEGKS